MKNNDLKLFEVEFNHRLYRTLKVIAKEGYGWNFESIIICCNNESDINASVDAYVAAIYDGLTYSHIKTYKCSYFIKNVIITQIELPEEVDK